MDHFTSGEEWQKKALVLLAVLWLTMRKNIFVATKKRSTMSKSVAFFFIQVRDQGNPVTDADHAVPGFFQVCRYAAKQVFFYTPDHIQDSTLQQPFQKQSEHQIRSAALKTS